MYTEFRWVDFSSFRIYSRWLEPMNTSRRQHNKWALNERIYTYKYACRVSHFRNTYECNNFRHCRGNGSPQLFLVCILLRPYPTHTLSHILAVDGTLHRSRIPPGIRCCVDAVGCARACCVYARWRTDRALPMTEVICLSIRKSWQIFRWNGNDRSVGIDYACDCDGVEAHCFPAPRILSPSFRRKHSTHKKIRRIFVDVPRMKCYVFRHLLNLLMNE